MRSRRFLLVTLCVLVLLASATGVGYQWLTTSDAIELRRALSDFRDQASESGGERAHRLAANPDSTQSNIHHDAGADRYVPPSPRSVDGWLGSPNAATPFVIRFPEVGVYTWQTRGFEETTPGIRRPLPAESRRTITHRSNAGWTSHHQYSDQHDEKLELALTARGVVLLTYHFQTRFGPFTSERSKVYDPPILAAPSPPRLDETWDGSWSEGAGTYSGRTFDHTTMRIGSKEIEVWGNELTLKISGEEHGEATFRFWWSPEHVMTVKEEGTITIRSGPRSYHRESEMTLVSMEPAR